MARVPFPPIEPPATDVEFPDPARAGRHQVMAVGDDLRPGTVLAAYRAGIFPWPHVEQGRTMIAWWSPEPRAILPLENELHWSRSLRRTLRRHPYTVTINTAFREVMLAAGERREGTWITDAMVHAYTTLHEMGWAHSVEVWDAPQGELVGGIYGIAIGAAFAGESMFHRRTDASKIAFACLAESLRRSGYRLFDVQVQTDHLASLGCVEVPRRAYLSRLADALQQGATPLALHEAAQRGPSSAE